MNLSFRIKTCILFIIIWLIPFSVHGQSVSADEFSAERAYAHIQHLSEKIGPRPAGSKNERKAAEYLYYILEQYGWKVKVQPFTKIIAQSNPLHSDNRIQVINSQNIIAELPGRRPETILLSAHYDSFDTSVPGAVDNASGVGVLLEIARILGQTQHDDTYQIAFFGAEEYGLVGSSYYVAQADLSALRWMLNIDMVGTPLEIDISGKTSSPPDLIKQVADVVSKQGIPFHISREFAVMTREGSQGGSSDFSPFLEQGIPAIGLGIEGRFGGFYHRPEDRIEQVSLAELDKVGKLIPHILESVQIEETGSRTWDTYFLPFKLGTTVILIPTLVLRLFYAFVIFLTGFTLYRALKEKQQPKPVKFYDYLLTGTLVPLSIALIIFLSGSGEFLWQHIKGQEILWYSYPEFILGLRVLILLALMVLLGIGLRRILKPVSIRFYWFYSIVPLLLGSILLGLYRIDWAFPFLFWLFCYNCMFLIPYLLVKIIFAITGPLFIYIFHWELLTSPQWTSFYSTLHQYPQVFLIIYTIILIPFYFAGIYIGKLLRPGKRMEKGLLIPALILIIISILGTGLVPNYTRKFPQIITVSKEWLDNQKAYIKISSNDFLPKSLVRELNQPPGKTIQLETPYYQPPLDSHVSVMQSEDNKKNITIGLKYARDPYLMRIKIESNKPFAITKIDDFLPIAKLPRKIKLEGNTHTTESNDGNSQYTLTLERTPPHEAQILMDLKGDGTFKCSLEVIFPDNNPSLTIDNYRLSPSYKEVYKKVFEF